MQSKFNVVQVKVATVSRSSRAILLSFWYFFYVFSTVKFLVVCIRNSWTCYM